ncbi:arrestin domain-containing protein 3 isoform X2 [Drosophila hydei]|uniref:Arrestin domain-containing protein 3 isoform X2 n=1 Tax=Drosophila hydei TaxID=7224 RepID=A0A6J1MFB9_DROHY|nr:arrestin domain-containing protein 3 isoform X2 [Drosophila hydei]
MVLNCVIDFKDNPFGIYYAGQVISGSVSLNSDEEKLVNAIILKIKGFAMTYWTEDETDADNKTTEETYSGHEDYIHSKVELLVAERTIALAPGTHVYNFACQIPAVCPSSFEGTHGRVRYTVIVKVIRPWKFDLTYSRPFTVLKVMDLNREGLFLSTPAQSEDLKTYNCWPCRSEPLRLQLSLPHRGFVPGQTIPVGVLITNDSHIGVEQIEVSLVMMVLYYSQHSVETISERFVVSKKQGEGVTRNCKKQFIFDLPVPATPPTCFDLCRIIQIAYQVAVETKVKGWHLNERVHLPVTIGNVPLSKQLIQQPRSMPVEVEVVAQQLDEKALVLLDEAAAAAATPTVNPWAADASIDPPSYAEAVHIRAGPIKSNVKPAANKPRKSQQFSPSTTQTKENCAFTPLYAVFHINNQTENAKMEDIDRSTWI